MGGHAVVSRSYLKKLQFLWENFLGFFSHTAAEDGSQFFSF